MNAVRESLGHAWSPVTGATRNLGERWNRMSTPGRWVVYGLLIIVGALVMMFVLDRFVNGTRFGRGIRATAQDPETAVLMGVDIDRVVMLTFLLGGAMAGVAGMLYLVFFEATKFSIGFVLGIKAFTAAVLGGIGNLRGALLGGLLLGVMELYGQALFGTEWRDVVAFVVLILVLMIRPTGILGESLGRARA